MVHPLIIYPDGPFNNRFFGNGILAKHRHSIGVYKFRNTVVDFRIDMIRSACKDNAVFSVFLYEVQGSLTLFHNVHSNLCKFKPCLMGRILYFPVGNVPEDGIKTLCYCLFICK